MADKKWYDKGLHFECQRCGECCRRPGVVYVKEYEIEQIAKSLNMPVEQFKEKYVTTNQDGLLILQGDYDGSCVFLDKDGGCEIYAVRPNQCWTWPFWPHAINSKESWDKEAIYCPGFNRGELITKIEIGIRMSKCDFGYYKGESQNDE